MNEVVKLTFEEFEERLDTEVQRTVQSFVVIGFLLRQAHDSDLLYEVGMTIYEYAQKRYGMDRSQVSRFMRINERYSEGGYSDRLLKQYEHFGQSKLAEMLVLPDVVADVIPAEATREEIRQIGAELREEEKITDLEVAMEERDTTHDSLICQIFRQYFFANPAEYIPVHEAIRFAPDPVRVIMDAIAPSGVAMKMVRIQGVGRMMVSVRGRNMPVEIVNTRSSEKQSVDWQDLINEITPLFRADLTPMLAWEYEYKKEFPEEVAPAQQKKTLEIVKPQISEPEKKLEPKPPVQKKPEQKATKKPEKKSEKRSERTVKEVPKEILPEPVAETKEEKPPVQFDPKESRKREVERLLERAGQACKAESWEMVLRHIKGIEEVVLQIQQITAAETEDGQMSIGDYPDIVPEGGSDE